MQNTAERIDSTHADVPVVEDRAGQALAALIADVVTDAVQQPARYLRETIVPEGGE